MTKRKYVSGSFQPVREPAFAFEPQGRHIRNNLGSDLLPIELLRATWAQGALWVLIQVTGADCWYTMQDGSVPTPTNGFTMRTTDQPVLFWLGGEETALVIFGQQGTILDIQFGK